MGQWIDTSRPATLSASSRDEQPTRAASGSTVDQIN
jgi:hypothetical protein